MTKKITKKTIEIFENEYEALLVTESEWDGQRAMAYHCVTGLLVGDWMNLVREYCERSGRKHFFGINNYGAVTVFFDCESAEEFQQLLRAEYREESAKIAQLEFLNPKQHPKKRRYYGKDKKQ